MTKAVFFSILGVLIIHTSCQTQSNKTESEESSPIIEDQISEDICFDPSYEKEQAQRDSLIHLFESPVNLVQMKKDIGFLSMGWSLDPKFLPEIPEGYKQYNYGAIGSLIQNQKIEINPSVKELRENADKFISIITHKPWTTAEEKYYSTDNEIVIGFETNVNYSELNSFNLVGDSKESIYEAYGQPDTLNLEMCAYTESQSVIVFHFTEDRVDWIKFYLLNKVTFLDRNYPQSLFEWTAK